VKFADHRVRPTLAALALEACAKVMAQDVSMRYTQGHEASFDQRPYFRMILNFQRELLSIPTSSTSASAADEAELAESSDKLLAVFAEAHHHYFSPEHAPGFCFSWLELVSHHSFMPRLLKEERGWSILHRLLIDLFTFMEPYLKNIQLTPAIRVLYKGTLRVLLVLLHDFPEFLCFFHFSLCNVIPPTCVQLRNLILSAFPRTMRLPDPFTPNLKVDLLPEITIHPRILADYTATLDQAPGNLRADVDLYLRTHTQPAGFLSTLKDRLRSGSNWNAMNALVLHVGVSAITWSKIAESGGGAAQQQDTSIPLQGARDIFQTLATELDSEARYQFLNAIANHLRYPNSHTHYFSCVILGLFKEGTEVVQEQVTRVLLERLIVHRPHPWGLLVTFIELMKNPRYAFWDHSFTRCTPEIHKVFESVANSCGAGQAVVMS
jgi:CCR4-NOT transcription complex subunit 1